MSQLRREFKEEKACLQETLQCKLLEHRCLLDEEKAKEVAAIRAKVGANVSGPPAYPPPPPPPLPQEVSLILNDDFANLPGRRALLPLLSGQHNEGWRAYQGVPWIRLSLNEKCQGPASTHPGDRDLNCGLGPAT
jgi:hypothetical protein